jgi:hypothetical protein
LIHSYRRDADVQHRATVSIADVLPPSCYTQDTAAPVSEDANQGAKKHALKRPAVTPFVPELRSEFAELAASGLSVMASRVGESVLNVLLDHAVEGVLGYFPEGLYQTVSKMTGTNSVASLVNAMTSDSPVTEAIKRQVMAYVGAHQTPALYHETVTNGNPQYADIVGGMRVRHSELIRPLSLVAGQTAQTIGLDLNPGLAVTFPWLSSIAKKFDTYNFKGLSFSYVPAEGTGSKGDVVIGVDFDPDDQRPADLVSMQTLSDAVMTQIAAPASYSTNIKQLNVTPKSRKYVRSGLVINELKRQTDVGTLFVRTDRATSTDETPVGFIIAHYDIELMGAQGEEAASSSDRLVAIGTTSPVDPWSPANTEMNLYPTSLKLVSDPYGVTLANSDLTLPPGLWEVEMQTIFEIDQTTSLTDDNTLCEISLSRTVLEGLTDGDTVLIGSLEWPVSQSVNPLGVTGAVRNIVHADFFVTAQDYNRVHVTFKWILPLWDPKGTTIKFTVKFSSDNEVLQGRRYGPDLLMAKLIAS